MDISGNVIVVGSYAYQQGPEEENVSYVFVKPGREWKDIQPTAILSISDKGSWRGLEESVSIYGNTIAVKGNGETGGGGVYVYEMPIGLAPGLYTAILQTNKDQTVRRLIVLR